MIVALGACGDQSRTVARDSASGESSPKVVAERCTVILHGKGGDGQPAVLVDDNTVRLSPRGNAEGWGGRQWLYFPDQRYEEALAVVVDTVDAATCQQVIVGGFSNGAAFVAAMWCRGDTLSGRLVGVVIDDPVPDHSADTCAPPAGVPASLYWTGALNDMSTPGKDCQAIDWTCQDGSLVGIKTYAANLGVAIEESPNVGHTPFADAPQLSAFP